MDTIRTRSRDKQSHSFLTRTVRERNGVVNVSSWQRGHTGPIETITDENHPGYAKRVESGEVIMGPLSLHRVYRSFSPFDLSYRHSGVDVNYKGDMFDAVAAAGNGNYPTPQAINKASIRNEAIISLLAQVNGTEVSGGEVMAEMAKTIQMLKRPFSNVRRLSNKIAKLASKKRRFGQTLAEANANAWLELNYGWTPVVLDVINITGLYAKRMGEMQQDRFRACRSKSKRETASSNFSGLFQGGDLDGMMCTGTLTKETSFTASAGMFYSYKSQNLEDFTARTTGMNASATIVTAYNLIPYSFVLDWFVNIGDWLTASLPNPFIIERGRWLTEIEASIMTGTGNVSIIRVPESYNSVPTVFSGTAGSVNNTVSDYSRLTTFTANGPTVNLNMDSLSHAISGAALMCKSLGNIIQSLRH